MTPRSLRRAQAAEVYGVSLSTVDRAVKAGDVRAKRAGRALLLCAEDCERLWGWPDADAVEPTDRDVAEVLEFMAS